MGLTHNKIMAMAPNELLEEIAKKHGWYAQPAFDRRFIPARGNIMYDDIYYRTPEKVFESPVIPDYPRDIAAAWELVEEIKNQCPIFKLQGFKDGEFVFDIQDEHFTSLAWATGETAPLAICRAWLIWKEDKSEF